jgi:hypothetical protein
VTRAEGALVQERKVRVVFEHPVARAARHEIGAGPHRATHRSASRDGSVTGASHAPRRQT